MTTVRPGPIEEFNLATNGRVCKETPVSSKKSAKRDLEGKMPKDTGKCLKAVKPMKGQTKSALVPGGSLAHSKHSMFQTVK